MLIAGKWVGSWSGAEGRWRAHQAGACPWRFSVDVSWPGARGTLIGETGQQQQGRSSVIPYTALG